MTVSQVAYVGIGVSDMARWQVFAADVLGMRVVEGGDDGTVYLGMDEYYGWGGPLIDDSVWQVQRHDRGTMWGHKVQVEPALDLAGIR